jgi:hypothetical protein
VVHSGIWIVERRRAQRYFHGNPGDRHPQTPNRVAAIQAFSLTRFAPQTVKFKRTGVSGKEGGPIGQADRTAAVRILQHDAHRTMLSLLPAVRRRVRERLRDLLHARWHHAPPARAVHAAARRQRAVRSQQHLHAALPGLVRIGQRHHGDIVRIRVQPGQHHGAQPGGVSNGDAAVRTVRVFDAADV